jgi:hypothetical protein
MYPFKDGNWDRYDVELGRQAEMTQFFQVVEVDGDVLRYRSYTATGELFDAFDLLKSESGPNRLEDRSAEGG